MLADPQNITTSAGAKVASRTLTGTDRGRFISPDQSTVVEVQTSFGKRIRTVAKVTEAKVFQDPLTNAPSRVEEVVQLTINRPQDGFSEEDVLATVKGFFGWLTASTDANLKKIIGGEN